MENYRGGEKQKDRRSFKKTEITMKKCYVKKPFEYGGFRGLGKSIMGGFEKKNTKSGMFLTFMAHSQHWYSREVKALKLLQSGPQIPVSIFGMKQC
jgi:hypothetical protein